MCNIYIYIYDMIFVEFTNGMISYLISIKTKRFYSESIFKSFSSHSEDRIKLEISKS